jgi:hypothetical protein
MLLSLSGPVLAKDSGETIFEPPDKPAPDTTATRAETLLGNNKEDKGEKDDSDFEPPDRGKPGRLRGTGTRSHLL